MKQKRLHRFALQSILTYPANWYQAFRSTARDMGRQQDITVIVTFGDERCVPPSLAAELLPHLVPATETQVVRKSLRKSQLSTNLPATLLQPRTEDEIAVVGMACRTAGADDLHDFWHILREGKSQHIEVPTEKFTFETHWRDIDPKRKWYGNFITGSDTFDHKFFRKSPRGVASQDPQQRLLMQVAYQALEQSGYFRSEDDANKHIGCFVGACATEYENNVACHAPNAFTATGNLRSFIAGNISHHFGWTGPSLTLDTACSASGVAIHQACKAIIRGECYAALAGGTAIMTSPLLYQNLAGASFLSPTGQCKPFDAKADGYCRGEAIAAVYLKKMSTAITDGDLILGSIASSAVYQNANCTPIVVPNASSLSGLFADVTRYAKLDPKDISVVEAHGTGTPIGDPAEYQSIRQVFGGSIRDAPLPIGSVKGLVGHTEGASGVVAVIKILLMIQNRSIPPQASFQTPSPNLNASPSDKMEIVTELKPWRAEFRAALINNYGASGSNASMVITEAPKARLSHDTRLRINKNDLKQPFRIYGFDEGSIRRYSSKLLEMIQSLRERADCSVAALAFALFRQSNYLLDQKLHFSCRTFEELVNKLQLFADSRNPLPINRSPQRRPVILCFGGQISTFIGLHKVLFDNTHILQRHLDDCDRLTALLDMGSIYPHIFQKDPIRDIVKLQLSLFSLQYACAKSWMDCGVRVAAVVGHSFGEITALCISGILSLEDTLQLIAGRAKLIQDSWGDEKGAMMAVEADISVVQALVEEANRRSPSKAQASIACFNGPRNFTVAGPSQIIGLLGQLGKSHPDFESVRTKKLSVTNAFHCDLVDPLMSDLESLMRGMTFGKPTIPIEFATESRSTELVGPEFAMEHMRNPVFFTQAVQRLSKTHPTSIWLEAGSGSSVTSMVGKTMGASKDCHLQAMNIATDSAWQNAVDTTLALWQQGIDVQFWPHHKIQSRAYPSILLPPYQFDKFRHWMELKPPQKAARSLTSDSHTTEKQPSENILTFVGYQNKQEQHSRFRINTSAKKYEESVSGHTVVHTAPICPATLQMDLVVDALRILLKDAGPLHSPLCVSDIDNQSPICVDPSRTVWLELEARGGASAHWSWKIFSHTTHESCGVISHATGEVTLQSTNHKEFQREWSRYERLVGHHRCLELLNSSDADDVIQGRSIYRAFADVVDYSEQYRSLRKLVGKGAESAGQVVKQRPSTVWFDFLLADCLSQVGGIWVNCMTDRDPSDIYIANGIDRWMVVPTPGEKAGASDTWDVFANHHKATNKSYLTDIFVFDAVNGSLVEVILGISYVKVSKISMGKMLNRLTAQAHSADRDTSKLSLSTKTPGRDPSPVSSSRTKIRAPQPKQEKAQSSQQDVFKKLRNMLSNISGIEPSDIKDDTELVEIGVDSLMGMEMARDIESTFGCSLSADQLVEIQRFDDLTTCVQAVLSTRVSACNDESSVSEESESHNDLISTADSTPSSSVDVSLPQSINISEYLGEFLGLNSSEVAPQARLSDLGVDSLLALELRADLIAKFQIQLSEHLSLDELSVSDLDKNVNGGTYVSTGETTNDTNVVSAEVPAALVHTHKNCSSEDPLISAGQPQEAKSGIDMPLDKVLHAFQAAKSLTDQHIEDHACEGYLERIVPKQTYLCVVLIVEAFEKLGCHIKSAQPGTVLSPLKYRPQQVKLVDCLYKILEREGRLIDLKDSQATRTAIATPQESSEDVLQSLIAQFPEHENSHKLIHYVGSRLAAVLRGDTDGIQIIFGTDEGRELVSWLYGEFPFNKLSYEIMVDFLKRFIFELPMDKGPLKILEMGAGTGGTTKILVPFLADSGIDLEYTFTDLSPSMVAAARKKYKQYPFMRFRTHNIEKPPADDLLNSQHIVIASNAIHATSSLTQSAKHIRQALRADGFLVALEMTERMYWIDIIFGVLKGWWLFDDGRAHAIAPEEQWRKDLQSVGFGYVDWTDGDHPEVAVERVIVAQASGALVERTRRETKPPAIEWSKNLAERESANERYVHQYTDGFTPSKHVSTSTFEEDNGACVLVTGASGSLGSHVVGHLARLSYVKVIVCFNRRSNCNVNSMSRQRDALASRGIFLDEFAIGKLKVVEAESFKPACGLSEVEYGEIVRSITQIVHCAWPMSAKRPLKGFERQFQVMRNMIELVNAISAHHEEKFLATFQFVSSIAVAGHYPLWSNSAMAPEGRMEVKSALTSGYAEAKLVCERMLDVTLHKFPEKFRAMSVRIGQIAGSESSGYWNTSEHLSMLVKSSQALRCLPELHGVSTAINMVVHEELLTVSAGSSMDTSQHGGRNARRSTPPQERHSMPACFPH